MAKKHITLTEQVEKDNLAQQSPFNKEGINSFLKDAVTSKGATFDENVSNEILDKYGYDYDKMVDDIGRSHNIPEENLPNYRNDIYNKYGFSQPHELEAAELTFIKSPVVADPEGGYERYKQLQDELKLETAFSKNIKPQTDIEQEPILSDQEKLFESQLISEQPDVTRVDIPEKQLIPLSPREYDLQEKAKAINQALREQADYNMAKLGYASEEHELIRKQYLALS